MATDGGSFGGPEDILRDILGVDMLNSVASSKGKSTNIPLDAVIETKYLFSDPTITYHLIEEIGGVQIAPICYANHGKYLQFGLLTIRGNQGYKSLIPITGWSPLIGFRWEKKS